MMKSKNQFIGISIGDCNGIGPEIILNTLQDIDLETSTPVIFAPLKVVEFYQSKLSNSIEFHVAEDEAELQPEKINVVPIPFLLDNIQPGKLAKESGRTAMLSIEKGVEAAQAGITRALVTAPISKEAVNLAGYDIPGHTEFLATETNTKSVLMMLVSGNLRVALVTTHIPIKKITEAITKGLIKEKVELLHQSLKRDFGITSPRIAVFGLNPHAGDGGVIGEEEIEIIAPAIKELQKEDRNVEGPFPADGFFGQKLHKQFDAILAMYHDQGLAPFKLLSFGKGVNFTAGLPIIRTSPDHGTAFNIAGKGEANQSSFKQAYNLAVELANRRNRA